MEQREFKYRVMLSLPCATAASSLRVSQRWGTHPWNYHPFRYDYCHLVVLLRGLKLKDFFERELERNPPPTKNTFTLVKGSCFYLCWIVRVYSRPDVDHLYKNSRRGRECGTKYVCDLNCTMPHLQILYQNVPTSSQFSTNSWGVWWICWWIGRLQIFYLVLSRIEALHT